MIQDHKTSKYLQPKSIKHIKMNETQQRLVFCWMCDIKIT